MHIPKVNWLCVTRSAGKEVFDLIDINYAICYDSKGKTLEDTKFVTFEKIEE